MSTKSVIMCRPDLSQSGNISMVIVTSGFKLNGPTFYVP
jgi:hypothetical protein